MWLIAFWGTEHPDQTPLPPSRGKTPVKMGFVSIQPPPPRSLPGNHIGLDGLFFLKLRFRIRVLPPGAEVAHPHQAWHLGEETQGSSGAGGWISLPFITELHSEQVCHEPETVATPLKAGSGS